MINSKLLEQFRSFYFKNYPDSMEQLIEYFSIFGGLSADIDCSKSAQELIQTIFLDDFEILNKKIEQLTLNKPNNKRLLRALAVSDRRIFSAFKRAHLNNGNGGAALNFLEQRGLISIEYSREKPAKHLNPNAKLKREVARHRISHKVLFNQPFVRFWFYFIAPHTQEILQNNYENFFTDFSLRRHSYTSLVFEELSEILLNYHIRDSQIVSSGSYWDANIEIDILTITDDAKIYIAECKWTNHKITKKELHKLELKCEKLKIKPSQIALFCKRGFSKELHTLAGKNLALYASDDFKALLKSGSKKQF